MEDLSEASGTEKDTDPDRGEEATRGGLLERGPDSEAGTGAYVDFEIEIGPGQGRSYPVAVIRSPAGEARGTMEFPYDEITLDSRLKDLQVALLRSGGARRQALTREETGVREFGQAIFDALLSGDARSRYDVSSQEARRRGKGLRLKLRIRPPELARLPWADKPLFTYFIDGQSVGSVTPSDEGLEKANVLCRVEVINSNGPGTVGYLDDFRMGPLGG